MNAIQYIFRIYGKESPKGSNDIINPRTLILDNIYITNVKKNHGIKIYKKKRTITNNNTYGKFMRTGWGWILKGCEDVRTLKGWKESCENESLKNYKKQQGFPV